jgi:hypothetical protein
MDSSKSDDLFSFIDAWIASHFATFICVFPVFGFYGYYPDSFYVNTFSSHCSLYEWLMMLASFAFHFWKRNLPLVPQKVSIDKERQNCENIKSYIFAFVMTSLYGNVKFRSKQQKNKMLENNDILFLLIANESWRPVQILILYVETTVCFLSTFLQKITVRFFTFLLQTFFSMNPTFFSQFLIRQVAFVL